MTRTWKSIEKKKTASQMLGLSYTKVEIFARSVWFLSAAGSALVNMQAPQKRGPFSASVLGTSPALIHS